MRVSSLEILATVFSHWSSLALRGVQKTIAKISKLETPFFIV
jgi:hypothetical protein